MWRVGDDLAFYIELEVSNKYDSFNASVGFGVPGALPRPYSPVTPESARHQPGSFRLAYLMRDPSSVPPVPYHDGWLELDPEVSPYVPHVSAPVETCLAKLPMLLDQIFERLAGYAFPFFAHVATSRGHVLASFPLRERAAPAGSGR
jgi:hypothetical protein